MRNLDNCEGAKCEYYRKFYDVMPIGPNSKEFTPIFNSTEERCTHPKVLQKMVSEKTLDRQIGVKLTTFNECPKR